MGRPFLYSLTYGEEGVVHAIESKLKSGPQLGASEFIPTSESVLY